MVKPKETMKALLIGALVLVVGCTSPAPPAVDLASEMAAVDALHQADVAAVMAGDVDELLALWTDTPVAFPDDGEILTGRSAIATMLEPMRTRDERPWKTVDYSQDFTEVVVFGEYGWDLGTVTTRMVHRTDGRVLVSTATLLRILRREPDGNWRVHRSAWSTQPPVITRPEGG